MSKIYIGTVAEKGAGKGLLVKITRKLAPHIRVAQTRFSDPLRDILTILGKEQSRENLQTLVSALRTAFHDEGILNAALKTRIENLDTDIIFLDGVRNPEEAQFVKSLGGVHVYIKADQKIRFERRRNDPDNTDEKDMDWEQFVRQDEAASEISIRNIGETMTDFVTENNGTIGEFEEKVKDFLEKHIFPRLV